MKHELTCSRCEYMNHGDKQLPCIRCISEGWDKKELHQWEHNQKEETT